MMYNKINDLESKLKNRMLNLYRLSRNSMISILLLFTFLHSGITQSNPDDNWTAFGGMCGVQGDVFKSIWYNDTLYIVGSFESANGIVAKNIAKWNGTQWEAIGAGANNIIWDIDTDGNYLYMVGQFTSVNGVAAPGVIKYDGSNWTSLASTVTGLISEVRCLGTDVYIGGSITVINGLSVSRVAKWDGTTWSALGSGLNNGINTIETDGKNVFVGGSFTTAGGISANRVAKWDGTNWSALGPGCTNTVRVLKYANGNLYAGGTFTNAGSFTANKIARWDGTSWFAMGQGVSNIINIAVTAIEVDNNNELFVGGSFNISPLGDTLSGIAKWNGTKFVRVGAGFDNGGSGGSVGHLQFHNGIVYASSGNAISSSTQAIGQIAFWDGNSWNNFCSSTENAISTDAGSVVFDIAFNNGSLYVAGSLPYVGELVTGSIARFDGTNWHAVGPKINGGHVSKMAIAPNNDIFVCGTFTSIGSSNIKYLARWDGTSWHQVGPPLTSPEILTIFIDGTDLYAGGYFTQIAGVSANRIAKWNGTSWSALGTGTNSNVEVITKYNNDIIVGGSFTTAGGNSANRIAKWDGTSWSAIGTGVSSDVRALLTLNNDLFVGGSFSTAGGISVKRIAKWNGTAWSALGSGFDASVFSLTNVGTDLYAGGQFKISGSTSLIRIAKWNGSVWSPLGSGLNGPSFTYNNDAMAVDNNQNIYCAGNFTLAGGKISNCIAKWTYPSTLTTYYQDNDNDGFGNTNVTQAATSQPPGYNPNSGDCDDNDAQVYPNSPIVKTTSTSVNWSDGNHWFCDSPSAQTDSIIIRHNTDYDIVYDSIQASLSVISGTLTIKSGKTLVLGSPTLPKLLKVNNGSTLVIENGAKLKVYGILNEAGGLITNNGIVEVDY